MIEPGSLHALVPTGRRGKAEVVHETPSRYDRMMGAIHGQPLGAETYTRLLIDGVCWMTDAEFECRTSVPFERLARGDVLVVGLGLGLSVRAVLDKRRVRSVVVLEINSDVIALVGPTLVNPKLRIVRG